MKKKSVLLVVFLLLIFVSVVPAQADVILPGGLTEIADNAFEYDTALSGHLEIPEGTTRIGDYAFGFCTGLTSVTIPESVTEIGDYAFYGCTGLKSLTLPSSMQRVGECAFYGCTGLDSLTLPATIVSIGDGAFYECGGMPSDVYLIDTPDAIQIFWYCPQTAVYHFSIREDGSLLLDGYFSEIDQANVPASVHGRKVTALGENVFNSHTELKNVTLPDTLEEMGRGAFAFCTGLTSVTIPSSVKVVGETVFYGCTGLKTVTLQEGLTTIGQHAFVDCTALPEIECPESLTTICKWAFMDCTALHTVKLPQGKCTVQELAFGGCTALKNVGLSENTVIESFALKDTAWLKAKAQAVVDAVTHSGQSDFEKVVALHDWITEKNQYDLTYTYYSAENLFMYHTGVCQAYTDAYSYMLKAAGIEVKEISGEAGGDGHAWNLVKLDGAWYHVDCTWDDPIPDGQERHDYCCVPDDVMRQDHTWNAADYPAATGTKYFRGEKAK